MGSLLFFNFQGLASAARCDYSGHEARIKTSPQAKAARQLRVIVIGFALGLAALGGLVYAVLPGNTNLGSPEIAAPSPDRQDGRTVTNADLAGGPILCFSLYHCPDFCPTHFLTFRRV